MGTAASCGGMHCQGDDFETMACSREAELAAKVTDLEKALEKALGECQVMEKCKRGSASSSCCRAKGYKCGEGEGDCDKDDDCAAGLFVEKTIVVQDSHREVMIVVSKKHNQTEITPSNHGNEENTARRYIFHQSIWIFIAENCYPS